MPSSKELIEAFKQKNGVQVDGDLLTNAIWGLLVKNNDKNEREASIRKYVAEAAYPQIAAEFELEKGRKAIYHIQTENPAAKPLEFFEEYMNIISEIVKDASDRLIAQTNAEKERLEKRVTAAKAALDEAKTKLDNAEVAYKSHHNGSLEGIRNNSVYVEKYLQPFEHAKIALEQAEDNQEKYTGEVPFEVSDPYFGMTADTVKTLLKNQEKSATFTEMRRAQLEAVGPAYPIYSSELLPAFKDDVKYANASEEQKRGMQEVYATKKLMQEQLENKTGGLFGWFWRLWYYKDIKAINNYIKKATEALRKAEFDATAETEADAAMEQGYFSKEYKDLDVEKALEEMRAKKNLKASAKKKIEEEKKENVEDLSNTNEKETNVNLSDVKEAGKNEAVATSETEQKPEEKESLDPKTEKPFKDQIFEIGFRPAKEIEGLNAQIEESKLIGRLIKANKNVLPKDIVTVYTTNIKKMKEIKVRLEQQKTNGGGAMNSADKVIDQYIADLQKTVSPDYQPMTLEAVKAICPHEPVVVKLEENKEKIKLSNPVNPAAPKKEMNPIVKDH